MKGFLKIIVVSLVLYQSILFNAANAYDDISESLTILAPTSLTGVMTKLTRIYSLKTNSTVSAIFDSSSHLVEIVESGEQADVIITDYRERNHIAEEPTRIDDLQNQGLIEIDSKIAIAQDMIVLVGAKNNPISTKQFTSNFAEILDSLHKEIKLIIPDYNKEPSGKYVKEALITSGNWKLFENRINNATSNKDAIRRIKETSGIGFVYKSDIFNDKDLVIIATIPAKVLISNKEFKYHEPIIFRGLVVAGKQMARARKFLSFLQSKKVKHILRKYDLTTAN